MTHALLVALLLAVGGPDPFETAKRAALEADYERCLLILSVYSPPPERYGEYCFFKAVCYYATNDRENALGWLNRLKERPGCLVQRHQVLAWMMEEDLKRWRDGDLGDIERDMRTSGDRLRSGKADGRTMRVQQDVIEKLDRYIKEQEDKANGGGGGAGDQKSQDLQKGGMQPGSGPGRPATDSRAQGGEGGKRELNEQRLAEATKNWGTLTPQERQKVIDQITRDYPPRYKPMIDEYFRSLNRVHGVRP
jgi:hypothetical protein